MLCAARLPSATGSYWGDSRHRATTHFAAPPLHQLVRLCCSIERRSRNRRETFGLARPGSCDSRLIRHRDGALLCPDSPAAGLERPPGCARAPSPPYRSHRRPHARATLLQPDHVKPTRAGCGGSERRDQRVERFLTRPGGELVVLLLGGKMASSGFHGVNPPARFAAASSNLASAPSIS